MDQYIEMLGHTFQDKVTGFKGVAESISFDLYGCVQLALKPPVLTTDKGEQTLQDGRWFDANRLRQTSKKRTMEIPTFARLQKADPGPADKTSILRA